MSSAPLFTVVVSGYRTAPWLPRALASVAGQTYTDFEAICYVEESPDDSLRICRELAARDARFQVVSAPVSGAVATTRNYAIEHARGEYLVALDGDDWLAENMLEKLAEKLRRTGPVDVLAFAAVTTDREDFEPAKSAKLTNFRPSDGDGVFSGVEALRRAGRNGGQFRSYTWLNAYRTAFLRERGLRQTDGVLMEDLESTPRIWFAAERFAYLDEVLYIYRRRRDSLTTEASSRLLFDLMRQLRSLFAFVAGNRVPADLLTVWSNQWMSIFCWFMFHPVSSRKFTAADRRQALQLLFEGEGKAHFLRIAVRTSLPKRLSVPLILLTAKGWQLPAKWYFQRFYYVFAGR